MTESKLVVSSRLTQEEVIKKLKNSTVINESSQSTYQQIFLGKVGDDFAEITDIYRSAKQRRSYKLKITISDNNLAEITISTNQFEVRQIKSTLLKTLMLPFGFILLILGFVYFDGEETFFATFISGLIFIGMPLLYKASPLTQKEFLSDYVIQSILKLVDPMEVKLLVE